MAAVAEEPVAGRNGSASKKSRDPSTTAGEPRKERRAAVVVGLLQLSPEASLRGGTFIKLSQSLNAAAFSGKAQTTVDLWLDSPGGSARDAYKIGLLLRSVASRIRVVIPITPSPRQRC